LDNQKTLILGIGNALLADEGVGVHMLDYLRRNHTGMDACTLVDGGTLSFTLAPLLEQAEKLVVIDAAQLDAPPGTVRVFEGIEMDRFAGRISRSVHQVCLGDLLAITHLTEMIPANRALVVIQPEVVDWGCTLSKSVQQALPQAAQAVEQLLGAWSLAKPAGSWFAWVRSRAMTVAG
jgi:hydrogenase maturation protease